MLLWRLLGRSLLSNFWTNPLKVFDSILAYSLGRILKNYLLKWFSKLSIYPNHTHFIFRINGLFFTLTHCLTINQLSFWISAHRSLIWTLSFTFCKHIGWLDSLHCTIGVWNHLWSCPLGLQRLDYGFVSSSWHSSVFS